MGRKRRGVRSTGGGGFLSSDIAARLRRVLAGGNVGLNDFTSSNLGSLLEGILDEPPRVARETPKSRIWESAVDEIIDSLPDECQGIAGYDNASYRIDRVYASAEIQGRWTYTDETFEIFVNCGGELPPAGCSCEASDGQHPCNHIAQFLYFLSRQLEYDTAPLSARINRGDFTPGTPSRDRYRPDRGLLAIARLDEILVRASSRPASTSVGSEGLPALAEVSVERIAWAVSGKDGVLEVRPLLQQQKKRGTGFTQGRKLALERLKTDPNLPLSSADREIINEISVRKEGYGYNLSWSLDPIAAIQRLVGHPHVLCNDQPCRVKCSEFYLELMEDNGFWRFFLRVEGADRLAGPIFSTEETLVHIDQQTPQVLFGRLPACGFQPLRALLQLTPVESKHAESLFEKARRLQAVLPLRLPEEVGGRIVHEEFRPALLLRSRLDGSLDYGLRVRSVDGRLLRPGGDSALRPDKIAGEPVQRQRNVVAEIERCLRLADDLGIDPRPSDHWHGSIRDFASGLKLVESLPSLGDEVEILWDECGEKPLTVLGHLTSKNVRVDITSKRNWFGITGKCDIGGQSMSLDKLLQSLPQGADTENIRGDYVRIASGQWARVSENLRKRLERLRDVTYENRKSLAVDATAAPAIRDLLDSDVEVKATKNWHECLARLGRAEQLDPQLPSGLQATLRDYQIEGYKWLRRLAEWGVGGVLADDMGLGKTLQMLAVLLDRRDNGPTLVIAPTSVGFNWVRETERFAPELRPHLYRETERADFLPGVGPGDLVVCSYALALRDADALAKVKWGTLVMDEAQAVKNSRSKTAQAIAEFDAQWTVALTGTPVENHLGELWSLFHVVSPGVFGGWEQFRRRYALPIEKHADPNARALLATRLQPFVLRRTKSEVLTELPPRTEMNLYVEQSAEERQQYERVRLSAIGEIDQIASLGSVQDQRFKLLALITRLRQFACHPGIVNKQWTGSSAKLDQLCETMMELKEEGHRALIFSQFTQHLDLIRSALDAHKISYQYLDGSTPAPARQQRVDAFQAGEGDAFLISLKAGGTGLNLTAADYVIHMDPWWNPAVEDQATDRAHRFGQDKPVMVYRIITRGTIEEEILSLHDVKRDLVASVLEGTTAAGKMSTQELMEMLRGTPE